jgi:hypothetical protein
MKLLLLLLSGCLINGNAEAQNDKMEKLDYRVSKSFLSRLTNKSWVAPGIDTSKLLDGTAFLEHRKPGVHRLPQDNMPCIVPDSTKTVRIPNTWKGSLRVPYRSKPPQIPNPGRQQWRPFPINNTGPANAETATK